MANKGKNYDLSNVGGKPKDWLQRGAEYDAEFSWWDDLVMPLKLIGLPVLLVGCAAAFIYGISQIGR